MDVGWGILGPGELESTRRVRTLGLAASTRLFNELAVPGLGGVWFGRQLYLATLGVLVAERAEAKDKRVTRIRVTNAIEALACWHVFKNNPNQPTDGRIRGRNKLPGVEGGELTFQRVSRPNFYVTQPMRMATVSALPALGLVKAAGSRFNSFSCSPEGLDFVEAVGEMCRPYNRSLVDHLVRWVLGEKVLVDSEAMYEGLSPLLPLSEKARDLLRERLYQGAVDAQAEGRQRRCEALDWVSVRRGKGDPPDWEQRPEQITNPAHWADLRAGAAFFAVQNTANEVLNELERIIGTRERKHGLGSSLPSKMQKRLMNLRQKAQSYLNLGHLDQMAAAFCQEMSRDTSDADVLRHLLRRDGRILRLVEDKACAGPAFRGVESSDKSSEPDTGDDSPPADGVRWPENISNRIPNLWWLSLDLEGVMKEWLHPDIEETVDG